MLADSDHYEKGRPAQTLSVLLDPQNLDQLTDILLTETTSLGVRYYAVHRHINYRKVTIVSLPEGEVRIKYAQMDGKIVNIAPEFEDCKVLAFKKRTQPENYYAGSSCCCGGTT